MTIDSDRPNRYPTSNVTDLEYTYGIPAAWGLRAARESAGRRWAHALRQSAAERQARWAAIGIVDDPDVLEAYRWLERRLGCPGPWAER